MKTNNVNLITFISMRSGVDEHEINYTSLIEEDLGISGDDAEELVIEFSKRFKVNIEGFKFDKYFHPEPSIFDFFNRNNRKKASLTVEHLAMGITTGRLDDDVINGKTP